MGHRIIKARAFTRRTSLGRGNPGLIFSEAGEATLEKKGSADPARSNFKNRKHFTIGQRKGDYSPEIKIL